MICFITFVNVLKGFSDNQRCLEMFRRYLLMFRRAQVIHGNVQKRLITFGFLLKALHEF